jgi:hypothetical protein
MFNGMDSSANNANREESKKNGGKEGKGNPASGGAAKKRLKSKKNVQKGHTSESVDDRMLHQ